MISILFLEVFAASPKGRAGASVGGLIHGDLSEFNVLVGTEGPVIIDLPQAVNAAGNNGAFAMLERDVNNVRGTLGRFAPEILETEFARRCGRSTSRAN